VKFELPCGGERSRLAVPPGLGIDLASIIHIRNVKADDVTLGERDRFLLSLFGIEIGQIRHSQSTTT